MAENKINLARLEKCDWQELRTELIEWDDCGDGIAGYDGLTRYWCPEAVFEVYWTAERTGREKYKVYLTEDLELAAFKARFDFMPSLEIKQNLAALVSWQKSAEIALNETLGKTLALIKE